MLIEFTSFLRHGFLDNTTPGIVTLDLWFVEMEEPMSFKLVGDCLRDLAGCTLSFKNKKPKEKLSPQDVTFLHEVMTSPRVDGVVGDITAALREREDGEFSPLCALLSIEWFDFHIGRCLIEGSDLELSVSEPVWEQDAADEQVQVMTNQENFRSYTQHLINSYDGTKADDQSPRIPVCPWDEKLNNAEGAATAYTYVRNKYRLDAYGYISEAYVMGWEKKLARYAEAEEMGKSFRIKTASSYNIFDFLQAEEIAPVQQAMQHEIFELLNVLTAEIQLIYGEFMKDPDHVQAAPCARDILHQHRFLVPFTLATIIHSQEEHADTVFLLKRISLLLDRYAGVAERLKASSMQKENNLASLVDEVHDGLLSLMQTLAKHAE